MGMNPEVKSAWIAALRCGAYQQTRHHLRDRDGYCCLGVLCDLASTNNLGRWDDGEFFISFLGREGDVEHVDLPFDTRAWARLSIDDCDRLAHLNDAGHDFVEIAAVIEREF